MKTQILILGFLGLGLLAGAQTPPRQVSDAFNLKFKNAEKISWNQEEANEWEAEFIQNGKETSASFDLSGNWLETETEISEKDLPIPVKSAIDKKYSGYKIEETEMIESPAFSGYEIVLEKGEKNVEVQVTRYGELTVKKEFTEEEGEKEESAPDQD